MLFIENIIEQSLKGKNYVVFPGKNNREYTIYLLEQGKRTEYLYVKYEPKGEHYTLRKDGKTVPNQDVCKAAYSMVCDLYKKQEEKKAIRADYSAADPVRQELYDLVGGPVEFSLQEELHGMNYRVKQTIWDEYKDQHVVAIVDDNGQEVPYIITNIVTDGKGHEEVQTSINGQLLGDPDTSRALSKQVHLLQSIQGPHVGLESVYEKTRDETRKLHAAFGAAHANKR